MTTISLGKIMTTWKGVYSAGTDYENLDGVTYNGSSYVRYGAAITNGALPTDTSKWHLQAAAGTNGTTPVFSMNGSVLTITT
jgi:hypothetical protein